ncbi:MAG: HAD family hydrolase [Zavarzinia sp.]|nr:HAD family hydrolase [Zavarzinia sp.]
MPNLLVIFDIDGTLIRSTHIDNRMIADAWADLHDHAIDTDWSRYRTSTDRGIAREILAERLNRPADDTAIDAIEQAIAERFPPDLRLDQTPGAARLLATLRALPGVGVAIASGSFPRTAALKLGAARLHVDQVPKAFSDAHDDRAGIIEAATSLACAEHALPAFDGRVYVGDGLWDLDAARRLGIGFVGVGDGIGPLRAAGATRVLPDFEDLEQALNTLFTAALVEGAA